jgi:hypothetical protein
LLNSSSSLERKLPRRLCSSSHLKKISKRDSIGDLLEIVLEILSQHCSRLLKEPATVLR